MTGERDGSGGDDEPPERRQVSLDEAVTPEGNQCEAIAEYTGDRCQHLSLPGLPYCQDHRGLVDDDLDLPEVLNSPKTDA